MQEKLQKWINNPNHLMVVLILAVIMIAGEAIYIFKSRKRREEYYVKDKLKRIVLEFENFWPEFVMYVLATSIILLFIASFIFERNITIQDINSWVSIILGLVALVIGIISLWLSFYSLSQNRQMQENVVERVNDIRALGIGWKKKNDSWCYFMENGEMAKNVWKKSGDNWYHLGEDGYMEKNKRVEEGDIWYFVDEDGVRVTDQFKEKDGKKMYFDNSGKAVKNGERTIDGKRYIFKDGYVIKEE